jgi:uncharacterized membrane protein
LTVADYVGLAFFIAAWLGYRFAVEESRFAGRGLNSRMHRARHAWMHQMLSRDLRMIDTAIMGTLQNGAAFFASSSIIALGGALALLRSGEEALTLLSDLPLGVPVSRVAWEAKVIGLVVIFGYTFFKFAWSYRLFNYSAILIGATPMAIDKDEAPAQAAARRAALMSIAAARHFNRGQRAIFFALAYLGWFINPYALIITTGGVLVVMWRRQFSSEALAALGPDDDGPPAHPMSEGN